MSDGLMEAAEKACEFADVFEDFTPLVDNAASVAEWWMHFKRLARAWREEYPEDDDEPITPEWLCSIGWIAGTPTALTKSTHVCSASGGDMKWGPFGCFLGITKLSGIKTRGDVRRLCRMMGVELKESK